jgi:hypothetical protein
MIRRVTALPTRMEFREEKKRKRRLQPVLGMDPAV